MLLILYVPSFVVPTLCKQVHKPRRSRSVRKLDAKKRRLWKNLKSSPCNFVMCQNYKDCADGWKRAVRYDEMLAEERVVTANNVGAFYKYVYKRTTNHCGIGVP